MDNGPCLVAEPALPPRGHNDEITRHGCLLEESFRNFAPLLSASQDYAKLRGCRFIGHDFHAQALEANGDQSDQAQSFLAAKLRALPLVQNFRKRLRAGEAALVEEIERAFKLVMVEGVRNAMLGTFQRLDMWPPLNSHDVAEDDCAYEDVSAPLALIAQRLHNDQMRRERQLVGIGGLCRLRQRAMTAAFLIDFTQEADVPLPTMPGTQAMMLDEFMARIRDWELLHGPKDGPPTRSRQFCGIPSGGINSFFHEWLRAGSSSQKPPTFAESLTHTVFPYGVVLYAAALDFTLHRMSTLGSSRGSASSYVPAHG